MARITQHLAFVDTHIVVWLYDKLTEKFSKKAFDAINDNELVISPLTILELQYLYEINRITAEPAPILASLETSIGLSVSEAPFAKIIEVAQTMGWTRDPFDRLMVAQAAIKNAYFITKDSNILKNYPFALW